MTDEGTVYRLRFETVSTQFLHLYCNADPSVFSHVKQIVPNSGIPDEHWHPVERITGDPWDQYRQLRQWAEADREFVRNVTLERQVSPPVWEPAHG